MPQESVKCCSLNLDTAEIKKSVLKANSHQPYLYFYKKVVVDIYFFSRKHLKVTLKTVLSTIFTYLKYTGLNSAVYA